MKCIGILPAAGLASRLMPLRYPKELLPVAFVRDDNNGSLRPILVAEYSLLAMRRAGIRRCLITISDRKPELLRYFADGSDLGLKIAYVHQPVPLGLAQAVDAGLEWISDAQVCLALPDTVFKPFDAIHALRTEIAASQADLVLGVFPTTEPERLGPVRLTRDGRVTEVLDKPPKIDIHNTWGVAIWSPRFSQFLHDRVVSSPEAASEPIGEIFNAAVGGGLDVRAVHFPHGSYMDLGTVEGLGVLVLHEGELGAHENEDSAPF